MAREVLMKNPQTGITKKGYYGFSWTTLIFWGLPTIWRGDAVSGTLIIIANLLTGGLACLLWAFVYNKHYTQRLIEKGYKFIDDDRKVNEAKAWLDLT